MDPKVKELNLLLIYLTGWEEDSKKTPGSKVYKAWNGYLFDIINELERENLIRQFTKILILTEQGKSKAEVLKQKYL